MSRPVRYPHLKNRVSRLPLTPKLSKSPGEPASIAGNPPTGSGRAYPPAAGFCGVCGKVVPFTWRGGCVDCEAVREATAQPARPRREIPVDAAYPALRPAVVQSLTPAQRQLYE